MPKIRATCRFMRGFHRVSSGSSRKNVDFACLGRRSLHRTKCEYLTVPPVAERLFWPGVRPSMPGPDCRHRAQGSISHVRDRKSGRETGPGGPADGPDCATDQSLAGIWRAGALGPKPGSGPPGLVRPAGPRTPKARLGRGIGESRIGRAARDEGEAAPMVDQPACLCYVTWPSP